MVDFLRWRKSPDLCPEQNGKEIVSRKYYLRICGHKA